jgi:hypothetical protein
MALASKFRASYTILNIWKSGDWERAIKYYFKLEQFKTSQMADGQKYHDAWEKYIPENKKLPVEFGGKQLTNPICETKIVVQLADWCELVGKIDCFDSPVIYEFKTGKQSSESYASSPQAGVYAILCTYSNMLADRAEIYHYDQYQKRYDMSYVWLTDRLLSDTLNWVMTLSGEMHDYFETNGLYSRFGGNLLKQNVQN